MPRGLTLLRGRSPAGEEEKNPFWGFGGFCLAKFDQHFMILADHVSYRKTYRLILRKVIFDRDMDSASGSASAG